MNSHTPSATYSHRYLLTRLLTRSFVLAFLSSFTPSLSPYLLCLLIAPPLPRFLSSLVHLHLCLSFFLLPPLPFFLCLSITFFFTHRQSSHPSPSKQALLVLSATHTAISWKHHCLVMVTLQNAIPSFELNLTENLNWAKGIFTVLVQISWTVDTLLPCSFGLVWCHMVKNSNQSKCTNKSHVGAVSLLIGQD